MAGELNRKLIEDYTEALVKEAAVDERISIYLTDWSMPRILVDGGKEHAYFTYAGLGEEPSRPSDTWTSHVVVTYATDNGYYDVLSLRNLRGPALRSPQLLAKAAVEAVRSHIAADFKQVTNENSYQF